MTVPVGDPTYTPDHTLPVGSLVYLASYLLRMKLNAETTGPDTPNLYGAELGVMGDQGVMDTDPLTGPAGFRGRHHFPFRKQDEPLVREEAELPDDLTNTPDDIGKYWDIPQLDEWGNVISVISYVWWGETWRQIIMGSYGPPGPVPDIAPHTNLIEPQEYPTYPDTTSWMDTSGTTLQPSWVFNLAVPAGIAGPVTDLYDFPDVDTEGWGTGGLEYGDLLTATDEFNGSGYRIWRAQSIAPFIPGPWSMPESAFVAYSGVSQRAAIGSFAIPPQPWPWTPIVWGHLGSGGLTLTANPLMIGVEVLLGDPVKGVQISRGFGNTLGEVNIMSHYSKAKKETDAITPKNRRALVPANHSDPAQGTIYVNLWNDGALGVYDFDPKNAQLFILVVPLLTPPDEES
jgi:hypothetical protein